MTKSQKAHVKMLQFAVEMSRVNFDLLNEIEIERLKLNLLEFHLSSGGRLGWILPQKDVAPEDSSDVARAVAHLPMPYVEQMVAGIKDTLTIIAEAKYPVMIDLPAKDVSFYVYLNSPSDRFTTGVRMDPGRVSAVHALFRHFEGSGLTADRVKICPMEDCRNIFIIGSHARTDRMRYCSVKCSGLAATRAYRQRLKEGTKRNSRKDKTKSKAKTKRRVGK